MEALIDDMGGRSAAGEIFELYLGELPRRHAAVLEAPDAASLGRAAHALGSPSGLVGATRLGLSCRAIEMRVREGREVSAEMIEELSGECARVRAAIEELLPALADG